MQKFSASRHNNTGYHSADVYTEPTLQSLSKIPLFFQTELFGFSTLLKVFSSLQVFYGPSVHLV